MKKIIYRFCIKLPILTDEKYHTYDSIFVIVDQFTKIDDDKPIKITIDDLNFTNIIINIIVNYYSLPNLIITNKKLLFISKF